MKLAIITGGSKGLGAALVDTYQAKGFMIKELSRSSQSDHSIQIDLSNTEEVLETIPPLFEKLASQPLEEVIFFNNAATDYPIGITSEKDTKEIIANINLNFTSPILLISKFVKAFQGNNCPKTIVNISSGASEIVFHGLSLYCGSKAGIEHFVRVVALEQKEQLHPIIAINISPGPMDTDMQRDVRLVSEEDFPSVERFRNLKDTGALRSPNVVAEGIDKIITSNPETGSRHKIDDYL